MWRTPPRPGWITRQPRVRWRDQRGCSPCLQRFAALPPSNPGIGYRFTCTCRLKGTEKGIKKIHLEFSEIQQNSKWSLKNGRHGAIWSGIGKRPSPSLIRIRGHHSPQSLEGHVLYKKIVGRVSLYYLLESWTKDWYNSYMGWTKVHLWRTQSGTGQNLDDQIKNLGENLIYFRNRYRLDWIVPEKLSQHTLR